MPGVAVKQLLSPSFQQSILTRPCLSGEENRVPFASLFRASLWLFAHIGLVGLIGYLPSSQAQTLQVRITVKNPTSPKVQIQLESPFVVDALSFRNSYGSVLGLAQRIGSVEAIDSSSERIAVVKRAPGEFRSARRVKKFSYEVDLSLPSRLEDMSHVSWLNHRRGLLLPADLLPRLVSDKSIFSDVKFSFDAPDGWTIDSSLDRVEGKPEFVTGDPDKAVFLVGADLRETVKRFGATRFKLTTAGEWPFSKNDLLKIAQKIHEDYTRITGFELNQNPTLMLIPFPEPVGRERWTAEARGNTVVLFLGSAGKQKPLLNRIGILLSHELFHLWVPNALRLEGDYDWFFEGFTLYQALLTDVKLGLISFDDYLATMGRVYRSYLGNPNRSRLSLIEASGSRWTGAGSLVYDKGMLLAFIYDLSLRSKSNCNASLSDVYRELFRVRSTGQANANETIIGILNRLEGSEVFSKEYLEGHDELRLETLISGYGFEVRRTVVEAQLIVANHVTEEQRRLIKCLRR